MREGVNKVALRLFEHNEKAYHAAVRMMDQYGKVAIVHPTGTGKSYIAFKLIEDNPEKVVIWLSPSEYIFKTQLESLKRNDPDFPLANVHFYTYAKLMCCTQAQLEKIAAQKPAYIILDEFHRAGAECWGESTVALLKLCPDAKLLGLTATNVRYLDNNRDMAEELFDGHIASDMNLGEAVVRGILPTPKYVTTVYQYQKALAKYQARVDNLRTPGIRDVNQKYLDALRRALEQADGLDRVFAHHITNKSGKYIVFCANKEHMDEMVSHVPEWFAGVNPDVVVYEAYSDDPNTDKAFADFKTDTSNRLKLIDQILVLQELTVLELRILELVAQFLNGVLREHSSGRITISTDSIDNFASVAIILSLDRINVPVSFAAALLRRETVFLNLIAQTIEALKHGSVHGVEAITQTIGQATYTVLQVVEVEVLAQVSSGQSTLSSRAVAEAEATAAPRQQEEQEEDPHPCSTGTSKHTTVGVAILESHDISHGHPTTSFHTHCRYLLVKILSQPSGNWD